MHIFFKATGLAHCLLLGDWDPNPTPRFPENRECDRRWVSFFLWTSLGSSADRKHNSSLLTPLASCEDHGSEGHANPRQP